MAEVVKFCWDHGGDQVFLHVTNSSGEVQSLPMQLKPEEEGGHFELEVKLPSGRYEYRFGVDGEWCFDEDLPALKNESGHYSNMIKVKAGDAKDVQLNKRPKRENVHAAKIAKLGLKSNDFRVLQMQTKQMRRSKSKSKEKAKLKEASKTGSKSAPTAKRAEALKKSDSQPANDGLREENSDNNKSPEQQKQAPTDDTIKMETDIPEEVGELQVQNRLQKCLSGEDTLLMSDLENVLSQNTTVQDNEEEEENQNTLDEGEVEEIPDEDLPDLEDALFSTGVSGNDTLNSEQRKNKLFLTELEPTVTSDTEDVLMPTTTLDMSTAGLVEMDEDVAEDEINVLGEDEEEDLFSTRSATIAEDDLYMPYLPKTAMKNGLQKAAFETVADSKPNTSCEGNKIENAEDTVSTRNGNTEASHSKSPERPETNATIPKQDVNKPENVEQNAAESATSIPLEEIESDFVTNAGDDIKEKAVAKTNEKSANESKEKPFVLKAPPQTEVRVKITETIEMPSSKPGTEPQPEKEAPKIEVTNASDGSESPSGSPSTEPVYVVKMEICKSSSQVSIEVEKNRSSEKEPLGAEEAFVVEKNSGENHAEVNGESKKQPEQAINENLNEILKNAETDLNKGIEGSSEDGYATVEVEMASELEKLVENDHSKSQPQRAQEELANGEQSAVATTQIVTPIIQVEEGFICKESEQANTAVGVTERSQETAQGQIDTALEKEKLRSPVKDETCDVQRTESGLATDAATTEITVPLIQEETIERDETVVVVNGNAEGTTEEQQPQAMAQGQLDTALEKEISKSPAKEVLCEIKQTEDQIATESNSEVIAMDVVDPPIQESIIPRDKSNVPEGELQESAKGTQEMVQGQIDTALEKESSKSPMEDRECEVNQTEAEVVSEHSANVATTEITVTLVQEEDIIISNGESNILAGKEQEVVEEAQNQAPVSSQKDKDKEIEEEGVTEPGLGVVTAEIVTPLIQEDISSVDQHNNSDEEPKESAEQAQETIQCQIDTALEKEVSESPTKDAMCEVNQTEAEVVSEPSANVTTTEITVTLVQEEDIIISNGESNILAGKGQEVVEEAQNQAPVSSQKDKDKEIEEEGATEPGLGMVTAEVVTPLIQEDISLVDQHNNSDEEPKESAEQAQETVQCQIDTALEKEISESPTKDAMCEVNQTEEVIASKPGSTVEVTEVAAPSMQDNEESFQVMEKEQCDTKGPQDLNNDQADIALEENQDVINVDTEVSTELGKATEESGDIIVEETQEAQGEHPQSTFEQSQKDDLTQEDGATNNALPQDIGVTNTAMNIKNGEPDNVEPTSIDAEPENIPPLVQEEVVEILTEEVILGTEPQEAPEEATEQSPEEKAAENETTLDRSETHPDGDSDGPMAQHEEQSSERGVESKEGKVEEIIPEEVQRSEEVILATTEEKSVNEDQEKKDNTQNCEEKSKSEAEDGAIEVKEEGQLLDESVQGSTPQVNAPESDRAESASAEQECPAISDEKQHEQPMTNSQNAKDNPESQSPEESKEATQIATAPVEEESNPQSLLVFENGDNVNACRDQGTSVDVRSEGTIQGDDDQGPEEDEEFVEALSESAEGAADEEGEQKQLQEDTEVVSDGEGEVFDEAEEPAQDVEDQAAGESDVFVSDLIQDLVDPALTPSITRAVTDVDKTDIPTLTVEEVMHSTGELDVPACESSHSKRGGRAPERKKKSSRRTTVGQARPKSSSRMGNWPAKDKKAKGGDLFADVRQELDTIQRSKSQSDIIIKNKLKKSSSTSKFLDEVKRQKEKEKEDAQKQAEQEEDHAAENGEANQGEAEKETESEEAKLPPESPPAATRAIKTNPYDDMPKKLDVVFGSIRKVDLPAVEAKSPPPPPPPEPVAVYYVTGDYSVSGMDQNVSLKQTAFGGKKLQPKQRPVNDTKSTPSSRKEPAFSLPGKPAKFPKLKPAKKEEEKKEQTPEQEPEHPPEHSEEPPTEELIPIEDAPPPPAPPTVLPRPPIPTILEKSRSKSPMSPPVELEPEPEPEPELEPIPAEIELPPEEEEISVEDSRDFESPSKVLPPKLGINGFERVGRLVLRAAIENGLDVRAINDPFIPANYMVYMLKFDLAHSHVGYHKHDMQVRQSPTGQLVIDGRVIHVFDEKDVTKIPWELAGVNYVVEGSEALSSLSEARLHLRGANRGMKMRHLVEEQARRQRLNEPPMEATEVANKTGNYGGCRNVLIAGPSPNAPLFAMGVNEDRMSSEQTVKSHVSAPAAALLPVLHILHANFGVRHCSYTLLKSVRGATSNAAIKCPNIGPSNNTKSVKWDFAENLVPAPIPQLEEECQRVLPWLHGRMQGLCVYVPTPEVSMLDLTIRLEKESESIYRDVCIKLKEAAEAPPMKTVMRYCMKMSSDNSASSVFLSDPHSAIVDAKSGRQVAPDTIKLVVWFDNEFGFANRIVDMITQTHVAYCNAKESSLEA